MNNTRRLMRTAFRALWLALLFVGAFSLITPGHAALIGADKALEQLKQAKPAEAAAATGPGQALEKELESFGKQVDSLAPEEAVRQWIAYYDRFWALPADQRTLGSADSYEMRMMAQSGQMKSMPLSITRVLGALPGPAAWPALEKAVEARAAKAPAGSIQELPLRFVTYLLCGRRDPLLKELEALKGKAGSLEDYQKRNFLQTLRQMELKLPGGDRGTKSVADRFERLLEIQEKMQGNGGGGVLKTPDLVRLVGEAKAADLLRRALKLPQVQLTVPEGGETLKLAQRLALDMGAGLKKPQWGLAASPGDVEFFEAMRKQFPETKRPDNENLAQALESSEFSSLIERSSSSSMGRPEDDDEENGELYAKARCNALLGLIALGRMADATDMMLKLADSSSFREFGEVWQMADQAALAPGVFTILGQALAKKPTLGAWDEYLAMGLQVGKSDEMIKTLRAASERKALKPENRAELQQRLVRALLAADQVDPAVALIRAMLQNKGEHETAKARLAMRQTRADMAAELANLGWLLKRPEWLAEGTQAARSIAVEPEIAGEESGYAGSYYERNVTEKLVTVLVKSERYEEAENLLLDAMGRMLKKSAALERSGEDDNLAEALQPGLAQLAMLYSKAIRPKDVMALLEGAPWWGHADLKDVLTDYHVNQVNLARIAAEALVDAGRKDEAVRLLKNELLREPSKDKNYELLCELEGLKLIPWLDELQARDRFEERPLVWKAWLLFKANRLEEAEAAARRALAIDPTDGEQPEGDRIRGYAVLGDILAARGKQDETDLMRRVVRSVRLAEQGDALAEAGLIGRSLKIYEEANAVFADAYCVRWRLAERLYAMGEHKEAEKHYQRAFEMMPQQFGRVASLCFGCQQVFNNQRSQAMGERVLVDLVKKYPEKPQVYYIMGMLRMEQNRIQDAYEAFRKAVKLDPEYLDAWLHLSQVADTLYLPAAERDAISIRMIELDPLDRHSYRNIEEIEDYAGLWKVVEGAMKLYAPSPQTLLTLAASKERLEARKKAGAQNRLDSYAAYEEIEERKRSARPAEAFASMSLVNAMLELIAPLE